MNELINNHHITKISVTSLFGHYSYTLPNDEANMSDLNIIYGENGIGKTTLLNLVFHLLSPSDKNGHRTKISTTPFSSLVVILNDGTILSATKDSQLLTGPVTFVIENPDASRVKWRFMPGSKEPTFDVSSLPDDIDIDKLHPDVKKEVVYVMEKRDFFKAIGNLQVNIYMLTSDRLLLADTIQENVRQNVRSEQARTAGRISDLLLENRTAMLNQAMEKASQWLYRKFLDQTYIRRTITDPYQDVVRKIASTTYKTKAGLKEGQEEKIRISLKKTLIFLDQRAKDFYEFGLSEKVIPLDVIDLIDTTHGNKLNLINTILEPHLEGLSSRFENLSGVYDLTYNFLSSVNKFFRDKKLVYSVRSGLEIKLTRNDELKQAVQVSQLSSGEQQLLLLFCYVLVAQDTSSIFIIDEPEISLNILWQRMLLSSLRDVDNGKNIQFVFASHSMEILAKHRNRVISIQEK
jgi:energy-coupling factor transporter ATP-binding protein EcfA2